MKIEVVFCELYSGDTESVREQIFDVPDFSNAEEVERSLMDQIEEATGEKVLHMAWVRNVNLEAAEFNRNLSAEVEVAQYRGDKALEEAHCNGLEWALNAAKARGYDDLVEFIEQQIMYFEE
jgi:hypothetical protein